MTNAKLIFHGLVYECPITKHHVVLYGDKLRPFALQDCGEGQGNEINCCTECNQYHEIVEE